jgi:drug/metabolite transporter (DMT)-like permease
MSRRQLTMLLVLSLIWGASFMFIKVAVRELEPSTLIWVRVGLGALTLIPISLLALGRNETFAGLRSEWRPFLVMGLLNTSIPFWLISWAEEDIDSGLAAILQAAAPLATAVLAIWIDRSQRVTGTRLVGLFVGVAGIAILVGFPGGGSSPIRALAVVASAACYALAALYSGRRLGHVAPLLVATGTMVAATLVTFPAGVVQAPGELPGWKTIGSMLALGIGGTALAYILYFGLIAGAGASKAILVTYLVPPLAVVYGVVLLNEPLRASAIVGLILILGGVGLGTGNLRLNRRRRERASVAAVRSPAR